MKGIGLDGLDGRGHFPCSKASHWESNLCIFNAIIHLLCFLAYMEPKRACK